TKYRYCIPRRGTRQGHRRSIVLVPSTRRDRQGHHTPCYGAVTFWGLVYVLVFAAARSPSHCELARVGRGENHPMGQGKVTGVGRSRGHYCACPPPAWRWTGGADPGGQTCRSPW